MIYQKNSAIEFLDIDEQTLVAYDPESGDMHYVSGTGKVILSLLSEACERSALIASLCALYEAEAGEIEADVTAFLDELAEKKVVLVS